MRLLRQIVAAGFALGAAFMGLLAIAIQLASDMKEGERFVAMTVFLIAGALPAWLAYLAYPKRAASGGATGGVAPTATTKTTKHGRGTPLSDAQLRTKLFQARRSVLVVAPSVSEAGLVRLGLSGAGAVGLPIDDVRFAVFKRTDALGRFDATEVSHAPSSTLIVVDGEHAIRADADYLSAIPRSEAPPVLLDAGDAVDALRAAEERGVPRPSRVPVTR